MQSGKRTCAWKCYVSPNTTTAHSFSNLSPTRCECNLIWQVAVAVARAVAQKAYEGGYATALPKPHNLAAVARAEMYSPMYRQYR
jgi:malate dehydrogenase (oxaloacetate-decarboxylating)(NADP+)